MGVTAQGVNRGMRACFDTPAEGSAAVAARSADLALLVSPSKVHPAALRRVPLNWAVMLWPAFAPWGAGQALQVAGQSMISSSQTQVAYIHSCSAS